MEAISKLIRDYENKLIDIERSRESDNRAGDHSFYMEYDTSKENINEFIGELRKLQALTIPDVVGRSEQLSISDFRVGFQYEEYQMDGSRYLNKGMIWVKKTYGINSPRLHKIQKLIDEGKLRKT